MLASSVEHGLRARWSKAVRAIRDLSPSIVLRRKLLAVDLTVSLPCRQKSYNYFKRLHVPETIEWE